MTPKFDNLINEAMGPVHRAGQRHPGTRQRTGDAMNRMGTNWTLSNDGVQAYNDIFADEELNSYLLAAAEDEKDKEADARGDIQRRGRPIPATGALARVLIDFALMRQDDFREFLPLGMQGLNQPGTKFTTVAPGQPAVGEERREVVDKWLEQYIDALPSSGALLDILLQFVTMFPDEFKRMMEGKYRVAPRPEYQPPDTPGPTFITTPLDER
jgi:hypothetical protein